MYIPYFLWVCPWSYVYFLWVYTPIHINAPRCEVRTPDIDGESPWRAEDVGLGHYTQRSAMMILITDVWRERERDRDTHVCVYIYIYTYIYIYIHLHTHTHTYMQYLPINKIKHNNDLPFCTRPGMPRAGPALLFQVWRSGSPGQEVSTSKSSKLRDVSDCSVPDAPCME